MSTEPRHDDCFTTSVESWTRDCLGLWNVAPTEFPEAMDRFTDEEREVREQEIERSTSAVSALYERRTRLSEAERAEFRDRMRGALLGSLLRSIDAGTELFMKECERTAHEFSEAAEAFDSSLPMEEVHQALRNQWVFNSIQQLLRLPVTMTPSSFAYSMLYPFTDNMIDGADQRKEKLEAFMSWLSDRLAGNSARNSHRDFSPVDRLIAMIEKEFPRAAYPMVHQSLRAIHRAQQRGLLLRGGRITGTEEELLAITFTKGGTSVLVDGCLISGSLDDDLAQRVFLYGVVLQLIDDLQDFEEDRSGSASTRFTRAADRGSLEDEVNRLLHFIQLTLATGIAPKEGADVSLLGLVIRSCTFLALEAIARQRHLFGAAYLARVQDYMPLRLDYLASAKERMTGVANRMNSRTASAYRALSPIVRAGF